LYRAAEALLFFKTHLTIIAVSLSHDGKFDIKHCFPAEVFAMKRMDIRNSSILSFCRMAKSNNAFFALKYDYRK